MRSKHVYPDEALPVWLVRGQHCAIARSPAPHGGQVLAAYGPPDWRLVLTLSVPLDQAAQVAALGRPLAADETVLTTDAGEATGGWARDGLLVVIGTVLIDGTVHSVARILPDTEWLPGTMP